MITTPDTGQTHPQLPYRWYRTPMDFAASRDFTMDRHWAYYAELSLKARLPLFHRATKPQWDRIPGDVWHRVELWLIPVALVVQIPFCVAFLAAWNFYFPSRTERLLWRSASVFHAAYSLLGTAYYFFTMAARHDATKIQRAAPLQVLPHSPPAGIPRRAILHTFEAVTPGQESKTRSAEVTLQVWAARMRNLSPDGDPSMTMSLRWTVTVFFPTVIYIFCRLFFYIEDIVSLRSQPADVYITSHSFLPFL